MKDKPEFTRLPPAPRIFTDSGRPNILDITMFKQTGDELKKEIVNAVKDTQRVVIRELPNQILMTKKQFDGFKDGLEIMPMYESEQFLYYTPFNAMEVRVK